MRISLAAQKADVHIETIRYYQRRGLLRIPDRIVNGSRRYSKADVEQIRFIKRAQGIGFTLDEIALLLNKSSGQNEASMHGFVDERIKKMQQQIHELKSSVSTLERMLEKCSQDTKCGACPLRKYLSGDVVL